MSNPRLTSEFLVGALELADAATLKENFFTALGAAVAKQPQLAEAAYRVAFKAAFGDENEAVRLAAFRALEPAIGALPSLPTATEIEQLVPAYLDHNDKYRDEHKTVSFLRVIYQVPEGAAAVLPALVKAMDGGGEKRAVFGEIATIYVIHRRFAEEIVPAVRSALTSRDRDMLFDALAVVEPMIMRQPELADKDLLDKITLISVQGQTTALRDDASGVLRKFARRHRNWMKERLPNVSLVRATAHLRRIAGGQPS